MIEGGLPADKIMVKPNFVDPDPGIGDGDGDFALFVGRLTEEKGILTLLKSWKSLYQTVGVPLKVVGDGPCRERVTEALRTCRGIEYVGRRSPADVYALMGAARVLMFPSQWYEGLPRTIIESFAKGTPVAASRLGSMPSLVDEGRTGVLFEPGDPEDLVLQTQQLFENEGHRAGMRQEARSVFESRYTARQNYPILTDCYDLAVGKRHAFCDNSVT
jgi:glycosyltransferase involved in cell wall biosynthesis